MASFSLLVALSAPASALAQSEDMARARAAYALGQQMFDAGDYEAALLAFRESLAAFPHFKTLFNIGLCEEKLGHIEAAIDMYSRYVDWPTEVPHRDEIVAKVAELKAMLPPQAVPTVERPPEVEPELPEAQQPRQRKRDSQLLKVGGVATLSTGGVAVAVGAALLIAAVARAKDIEDINASPQKYQPSDRNLATEGRRFETAGWVVSGIGVGLTAAGAVLLWLARGGRGDNAVTASACVVPAAHGAAAVATWRF